MNYNKISLEELFIYYHTASVACECNADEASVNFHREV